MFELWTCSVVSIYAFTAILCNLNTCLVVFTDLFFIIIDFLSFLFNMIVWNMVFHDKWSVCIVLSITW